MTVTHEIDGKVGVVTLAKPPHNLLDDQLINDLVAAYRAAIAGGCRAILLRSSMRHFCAGAEMASWGTGTIIHTDQAKFEAMMRDLEDAPVPTVAAINGGIVFRPDGSVITEHRIDPDVVRGMFALAEGVARILARGPKTLNPTLSRAIAKLAQRRLDSERPVHLACLEESEPIELLPSTTFQHPLAEGRFT